METLNAYLGKFEGESIFLNNGKFSYYLNHNKKLYSVPQCFQKPTFKLKDAVKIIEYRRNKEAEKENDAEPKGATDEPAEGLGAQATAKHFKKNKKKVLN